MAHKTAAKIWVATAIFLAVLPIKSTAWAADYDATCRYFSNQAFQDRRLGLSGTFRMKLAQDCVDAVIYARSDQIKVKKRADAYLAQLQAYRAVIAGMMMARMQGADAPRDMRRYSRPALASVSEAGAYLIARDMGLFDSHAAWTAWRLSLAAGDPRVRLDEPK